MKLSIQQRADGWWLVNVPNHTCCEHGPYRTRREALEARDGTNRFFASLTDHERRFFLGLEADLEPFSLRRAS